MSKYIYTTIYEQFTGLKPPEPSNHTHRRKRGYGHPYRMRLNTQEDDSHTENEEEIQPLDDERDFMEQQHVATFQPSIGNKASVLRFSANQYQGTTHNNSIMTATTMNDDTRTRKESEPKVTYKKRKNYNKV